MLPIGPAPGVEPDGPKTKNIKGRAGLHKDRADLDDRKTVRLGSLGDGRDRPRPVRNG